MGKEKKEHYALYKSLPSKGRFWIYSEHCYTPEEIHLRELILKARSHSAIDQEYLISPFTWFREDNDALINVYENAWFFSNAYKTRDIISRDEFHIQPIDSQRLQWPALYHLMQNVGDYLLLRNKNLPLEHLNQPMNFFFLDVINILKGLSQNTDINQVQTQLDLLTRYIRNIEKNISASKGSDRLFLANFRAVVDNKIHPQLSHLIESQLLKERLHKLAKSTNKLATEINRTLHFGLNLNPVNPHPYDFSSLDEVDTRAYPTQAAKKCGQNAQVTSNSEGSFQLTAEQLSNCHHLKLISDDKKIIGHYAAAISNLNELERFQQVISQIIDLLSQAGEVYTIYQFKEQMITLLKHIDNFVDESSVHIKAIIEANTQAYHKAIQDQQNLSLWQKVLTHEKEKLQIFIKNQDTLAQFPSSLADFHHTCKMLKAEVHEVIHHLHESGVIEQSFDALHHRAQELDKLMGSMHQWVKIQYEMKGLPAPQPVQLVITKPLPEPAEPMEPQLASNSRPFFYAPSEQLNACSSEYDYCRPDPIPVSNSNAMICVGLIVFMPVALIALYLLYKWYNQEKKENTPNLSQESLLKDCKQLIDIMKQNNFSIEKDYAEYFLLYEELSQKAEQDRDRQCLEELHADLEQIYIYECASQKTSSPNG